MDSSVSEILATYLRKKDKLIYEATGLQLYTEEDIAEVVSWGDDLPQEVTDQDSDFYALYFNRASDISGCPWCWRYLGGRCLCCSYGFRHGVCGKDDSNYTYIVWALGERPLVAALPEVRTLVKQLLVDLKIWNVEE